MIRAASPEERTDGTMWWGLTTLKIVIIALFNLAAISFLFILWQVPRAFDFSARGFEVALGLYRFPLACLAAAIALLSVWTTIAALRQSTIQSAAATWALVQSNFMEHARGADKLPTAVLRGEEALTQASWSVTSRADERMFSVAYASPITTLRRLYDTRTVADELEPHPHPKLIEALDQIDRAYDSLRKHAEQGDPKWLTNLVELAVATRQLREYLVLAHPGMAGWHRVPVLEKSELGKADLPPYDSCTAHSVVNGVWQEMLCIVHALHFSQRLENRAKRMFQTATSVGKIWSAAPRAIQHLGDEDIGMLWREPHRIEGRRISI